MSAPRTLEREGIARLIPHSGNMCLNERLESWGATEIHCSTHTHLDAANPMRSSGGLLSPCAIEYAGQAMALHGGLLAQEGGDPPSAGFIASVRNVRLHLPRLDLLQGALHVYARRLSGGDKQVLYEFELQDARGERVADGRAIAVLNTPLPGANQEHIPA